MRKPGRGSIHDALGFAAYIQSNIPPKIEARLRTAASAAQVAVAVPDTYQATAATQLSAAVEHTKTETPQVKRALDNINDPPHPEIYEAKIAASLKRRGWLPLRDLKGLDKSLTLIRDRLVVQEGKIYEIDKKIQYQKQKVEESRALYPEAQMLQEWRLENLVGEKAGLERDVAEIRGNMRTQIGRIKDTITQMLHIDTTPRGRLRTLFRKQGVTVVGFLSAIGMCISAIVLAITGSFGVSAAAPSSPLPPPPPAYETKEWIKQRLQDLGRLLGKAAVWVAGNLWLLLVALEGLLLVSVRDYLTKKP